MAMRGVTFVDPGVLEKVESSMAGLCETTGASAVMLIDRSGVVVTSRGDLPLHPDQTGATAAGVVGAMKSLIKAARSESFSIRIPSIGVYLQFQSVDDRLFLMAFYGEARLEETVLTALQQLATEARPSLTADSLGLCIDATSFIEGKLNEILKQDG